ncbi:MAG: hypothetical protein E6H84_09735 [Chloroflexi bacterium]|nr:MAG: hypothetical protein E6H84_09735 [Chloroflexota bacterium]TMG69519.1 MAG: hypothetical protein E6H81_10060 [Chloroflexota bacterium]
MFVVLRASVRMFVLGFIAGTLLAPRAGVETRKLLGEKLTVVANQILELAALPPIESARADQNGGDAPRTRRATRRSDAREDT